MARSGTKPSSAKRKSSKSSTADEKRTQNADLLSSSISKDLQQKCLKIFHNACQPSADDGLILQEVKGHLYNRDFATAFGRNEYLRVYASRWSPSRALAYLEILENLATEILPEEPKVRTDGARSQYNIVCLGGGAGGELVALGGWLRTRMEDSSSNKFEQLNVTLIDIADWTPVITALHNCITSPPELSKYASQAKKDANTAFIQTDSISLAFKQEDILSLDNGSNSPDRIAQADLVTFMFTLNELYSTSMSKTQYLLSTTLDLMKPGSHLLVVDSPGSYSTVSINGTEKKYPMQWLLDYTLIGNPRGRKEADLTKCKWTVVLSDDSRWFRLPPGLEYPIELENMRYQIHLYRRQSDTGE